MNAPDPDDTRYAVRSDDGLNGEQVTEKATLAEALAYVEYLQRISVTRERYPIRAELVERGGPDEPWSHLPVADALARIRTAWDDLDAAFAPVLAAGLDQASRTAGPSAGDSGCLSSRESGGTQ